jgi:hypothetical protein
MGRKIFAIASYTVAALVSFCAILVAFLDLAKTNNGIAPGSATLMKLGFLGLCLLLFAGALVAGLVFAPNRAWKRGAGYATLSSVALALVALSATVVLFSDPRMDEYMLRRTARELERSHDISRRVAISLAREGTPELARISETFSDYTSGLATLLGLAALGSAFIVLYAPRAEAPQEAAPP